MADQGRIDIGQALGTGARFAVGRPLTVLLWSAVGFLATGPIVLLALAGMSDRLTATPFWAVIMFALFAWSGLIGLMLTSAAMRSLLKPEDSGFGYLRWGDAEWRILTMGLGRNPNSWPYPPLLLVIGLTVVFIAGWFVFPGVDPRLRSTFNLVSGAVLVAAIVYAGIRSSLAPVAAHAGRDNPQRDAWNRSGGQVLSIALLQLCSHLIWLATSALIAAGAWYITGLGAGPGGRFLVLQGGTPAGLAPLFTPNSLIVAYALALIGALHSALCVRPAASAWRMLASARGGRSVLAEAAG